MKKVLFAICSLCIAASAVASPLSALADGALEETYYPEIFDDKLPLNNLTDFAIANDNLMAFAQGSTLTHWQNENTTVYEFDSTVTNVDYSDGKFYYSLDGGITGHILPDDPNSPANEPQEYNFFANRISAEGHIVNGFFYYCYDEFELFAHNMTTQTTKPLILKNAKVYSINGEDRLFAIRDIFICEIVGFNPTDIQISYSNYDKLLNMSVGDAPEKLNTYGDLSENPKYVSIAADTAVTAIDLNLIAPYDSDGNPLPAPQYFPISDPKGQTRYDVSGEALLLCQTGNATLVAKGSKAYILNSAGVTGATDIRKTSIDQGTTAAVNAVGEFAHSLPFMSNATRTFALAPGEIVTVLYEVSGDNIAHRFYLVENAKGERGYVIDEFLGDFNVPVPDENSASVTPDPNPHTDDYIRTVVLVIVIILLVLIAAGYLTWLCASNKQNKSEKKNDGEIDLNDISDDDNKE